MGTPDTHYRVTVGSLLIRPRDLTRLGIALCGDGTVDGVRVLSEKAIAMMRQEQSVETTGITSDTPGLRLFTIIRRKILICSTGGAYTAIRARTRGLSATCMSSR